MDRDAVRAGDVVAQHPRAATDFADAHPPVVVLRSIEITARIERDVVRRDDVAALRADALHATGCNIQRADLASDHLRYVDAAIRPRAETIGAEEAAGRGELFQAPAFGRARRLRCRVTSILKCH